MKQANTKTLAAGIVHLSVFGLWTYLIGCMDVQPLGPGGSCVGFASLNGWFHQLTGVHMQLYTVTDWLGLIPLFICLGFGCLGLTQWIRRKRLLRVDWDILLLGIYYLAVIFGYLFFEMVPINYRPILIDGRLEASYPSSTTLLVLSVMPTLVLQAERRIASPARRKRIAVGSCCFTAFMVIGRLICGVHWLTDIVGAVLLSTGLYFLYAGAVLSLPPQGKE